MRIEEQAKAEQALRDNYRKTTGLSDHPDAVEATLAADFACPACGALAQPTQGHCPDCGIRLA
ncbi:MAG: zinc ribbon domain-containing protein [Desulfobulbaceae bacterium]|nr:zinc ribbon domain-containing protein [Desulfobulbaceae bacterium]